ncbi:MAG: P-loop NTPase [Peptococcaceae bacterium]|nr:P-loop NTPase [Peptococcaceae bacterium]
MKQKLTIAVASGKGGTGKTTVSASLALAAADTGHKTAYMDCDVEEPNGHLFLKPNISYRHMVGIPVPIVDQDKCTACGLCGEICQFSAIVCINKNVLTFDKMCHGCGGCSLVCPAEAITEHSRNFGVVETGDCGNNLKFYHGKLDVGEIHSPPLIEAVRETAQGEDLNIVDASPGTSCPVVAAIKGVDYILLVTEPTPFGVNDLEIAVDMVKELGIPHAVVINRSVPEHTLARDFCRDNNIKILAEIPDDRRVAEAYSKGELPYSGVEGYRELFKELIDTIIKEAGR